MHQHTDKKALRREKAKKIALGHKEDDHEEEPTWQRPEITSVLFSYVGTDAQFDEFLKGVIHDYLSADHPYTKLETVLVDCVESEPA